MSQTASKMTTKYGDAARARAGRLERRLVWGAAAASLVLLNVVGLSYFARADWTRGREFTLSPASVRAVRSLSEPVTVRAYFSRDLPPPHASQARYVKDLLDSFYAEAHGKLRFAFVDPSEVESADETDRKSQVRHDVFGNAVREPTAIERELQELGIPSVQVRVNQADKLEVKRAYMGLALESGGRREVIPVVADTAGLEYDLTSMVRKLGRQKAQKLAVVAGDAGTRPQEEMGQALAALKEHYELAELDLAKAGTLLPDSDAVLVVGPSAPLGEAEQRTLEAYLHAGHPVGFFLPPARASLQGLQSRDAEHGLAPLLARLGVAVRDEMVLDAHCATINVQKQQGFMRVNQPVRYPFVGQYEQLGEHPVTRGLSGVMLPFSGSVDLLEGGNPNVTREVWARSSDKSWLQPRPYNMDPLQRWTPRPEQLAPRNLVVALQGPMGQVSPPASASGPAEGTTLAELGAPSDAHPATRVLVAASDAMLTDPFLGKANEALLLNMVDWLLGDDALLAVRGRGLAAAPLEQLGEARRRGVKYGNVVGLPLGFLALGLHRWRRRQARRDRIQLLGLEVL